jgi:hypothetical protein
MNVNGKMLLGATGLALAIGWGMGLSHTRSVLAQAAEEAAATPTNSFTMCLLDAWAETGELNPDWKGRRGWVLVEKEPVHE